MLPIKRRKYDKIKRVKYKNTIKYGNYLLILYINYSRCRLKPLYEHPFYQYQHRVKISDKSAEQFS